MYLRRAASLLAVCACCAACLQAPPECSDQDGDGYGAGEARSGCTEAGEDCDDQEASVYPGAEERCDGLDNNCDGTVDEEPVDGSLWYLDSDGDGFGHENEVLTACSAPTNYVAEAGDCDDTEEHVHPGAFEYNDDMDNDCDGNQDFTFLRNAALKMEGEAQDDSAGGSVAGAGDFDGDGTPDLLVGALNETSGGTGAGAVYVVSGNQRGELPLGAAMAKWMGEDREDQAGWSLAGVGDINDDGRDDILVGAPSDGSMGLASGAAYLVYGALYGEPVVFSLAAADVKLQGGLANDKVGMAVAGAGDMDEDGLADFLVGASGEGSGGVGAGAVYLVTDDLLGSAPLDNVGAAKLTGSGAGEAAGTAVAGAADVNGDGHLDVVVGAPAQGVLNKGATYLAFGPLVGDVPLSSAACWTGEQSGDRAGESVALLHDVNGDGYADTLIGAPFVADSGADAGAAYLLLGSAGGAGSGGNLASADAVLLGKAAGHQAGWRVADAGDVNGDGRSDGLISAHGDNSAGDDAGVAYLLLGPFVGTFSLADADAHLVGEAQGDSAGISVAGVGDLDDDGFSDLLVGASGQDAGGRDAGAAYLLLGGD